MKPLLCCRCHQPRSPGPKHCTACLVYMREHKRKKNPAAKRRWSPSYFLEQAQSRRHHGY